MKKLGLKNLKLITVNLLQKEQLRSVLGGSFCGGEAVSCNSTCNEIGSALYSSSLSNTQIIDWHNACFSSCCNG